jgi:putative RNA 2'-phosphotransferase
MQPDQLSKTMTYILRHHPEAFGLTLSPAGFIGIPELAQAITEHKGAVTEADILQTVAMDEKSRFTVDGEMIRAAQGHSTPVELGHPVAEPPEFLFHGTVEKFIPSIMKQGLLKGERHAVHLSESLETATIVGARRGTPIILKVSAHKMFEQGFIFTLSENKVWLVSTVPAEFITTL